MAHLSAELTVEPPSTRLPRTSASQFLHHVQAARRVVFVSHLQPDPDSLGSMLALAHLVKTVHGLPVLITRDGMISRAENRAMVEVLGLELTPVEAVKWAENDAVVMVDSQPKTGRHSLPEHVPITAVIDHHNTPGQLDDIPYIDIQPDVGATCTVVCQYLMETGIDVPQRVATALMYGIETEVMGYPREACAADDEAMYFLYPKADKDLLAQIRNARLPHSHFECLLQALQSSFIYDRLIISWVDTLPQPEQAAEVVDFMIRFEEVDWAVCCGVYEDKMILSVRSAKANAKAGEILRKVVGELGRAGGHERRAGGCIPLRNTSDSAIDDLKAELRRRFLKRLKLTDIRGQRLVPLREMLSNLQ